MKAEFTIYESSIEGEKDHMKQLRQMKKDELVTARLPKELKDDLQNLAEEKDLSLANLVTRILYNSMLRRKHKKQN